MEQTTKNIEMENIVRANPDLLNINDILADLNYSSEIIDNNMYADPNYRTDEFEKILNNTYAKNNSDANMGLVLSTPSNNNNTTMIIHNKYTECEYGTDILKELPLIVHTKERSMSMKIVSGAGTCGFLLGGLGLCFGIIPGVIGAGVGIGVGASVASVIYFVKEKTTSKKFKAISL